MNPARTQPDLFVGGAMRSGTTLVNRLLCTAPDVNDFVPEAHLLREVLALCRRCKMHGAAAMEPFFSDPDASQRYFAGCVDHLLEIARARHNPGGAVVLKNPELTMYFSELARVQPRAQFVLVVRDPRDCIASMKVVADRAARAGVPLPMREMAAGIEGMATLFLRYYADVVSSGLIRDRQRLLTIRYEDLVNDRQKTVARLSLWSGLDIDPDAIEQPASGDDGSIFGARLYGERISGKAVGGFAKRLTADETAAVERITRDFMQFYGYALRPDA